MTFSPDFQTLFVPFSGSHIIMMIFWIALWITTPVILKNTNPARRSLFSKTFGTILIVQYLLWMLWEAVTGTFTLQHSLPLNLCDFSNFLCALLLFNKSSKLFKIIYFWVLGGTIQSFITPNITFAFPHYEFYTFYLQHGGMILVMIYMIFVEGLSPHFSSVFKSAGILILYFSAVYIINLILGSNYNFLMADTPHPSTVSKMIQLCGEPPRHLIGLGAVLILTYIVLYLPFFIKTEMIKIRRK